MCDMLCVNYIFYLRKTMIKGILSVIIPDLSRYASCVTLVVVDHTDIYLFFYIVVL